METPVLLVSDGIVHPSLLCRYWLQRTLGAMPSYRFVQARTLEVLPELEMASFPALVLYLHHNTLSAPALEALERYVCNGGGFLAVHSASASYIEQERFSEILGGQFAVHGPVESFEVQPSAPGDDIFGGITAFSVKDELYRHQYDADNRIHFHTVVGDQKEPVVWTRPFGRGRVCYCALGHTESSMRNPQVHQILKQGLAWVCG